MNHNDKSVLIIEDDPKIRRFIKYTVEKEGFCVHCATNAKMGLGILLTETIDIVLLDLGLPDMDGIDVIQKLREWSDVTIIVVSARDQDREKVAALDMGADDYITKPFSAMELLARIRVALRHLSKQGTEAVERHFVVGELEIQLENRKVFVEGNLIHLTPKEYKLLTMLATHAGKVVTTGSLLQEIWGLHEVDNTQVLRAVMASLRRKIEKIPASPRYIITEIGVGYRLVDE